MCLRRCGARCRATELFTKAVIRVVPAVVSSLRVVAGLQRLLSFPANSGLVSHFCQAYLHFYSYSRICTSENNMMWTVLLTIIRKARNHCQDVDHWDEDHCQYHLGIDHCQTGNRSVRIESTVRMKVSTQIIKTSGLP